MITIFFSSYQGKPKKSFFFFSSRSFFLSRSLFFSLKKPFPLFPLRPLFFFFLFFLSFLSLYMPNLQRAPDFSPMLSVPIESPPRISQKTLFFSSKRLLFSSLFQTSSLSIRTTPFSFSFSSGNPHLQP